MNKQFPSEKFEYALDLFIRIAEKQVVYQAPDETTPLILHQDTPIA